MVKTHQPCPECGSSDALTDYGDHVHCFSCGHHTGTRAQKKEEQRMATKLQLVSGESEKLENRKITQATCEKWRYEVGEVNGRPCQIANYCDDRGRPVAQKIRFEGKEFTWAGDPKKAGLYGKWLWRDGGKTVVVTEGEIDALTMSQVQGNKWAVVSVPNGAQGAAKSIAQDLEWLEKFESVVFMFDNDEPGKAAVEECVQLLSPGKAKIATLPLKDPNEMLQKGRGAELVDAMWGARVWRPDEIVAGTDMLKTILEREKHTAIPYPWSGLNTLLRGIRQKEITTLCAGSGIGKSTVCRELCHWLLKEHKQTVAYIALEESAKKSALGVLSVDLNIPLHLTDRDKWPEKKLKKSFAETVGCGRWFTYDHFGSLAADNLLSRIRYLIHGCGCRWIILDHLSIVVSGMEGDDERRMIDNLMTKLRALVEETGAGLIVVSHLNGASEGKSLEEGGKTHLNMLRGSRSIGQLSDIVIGFERDQQSAEDREFMDARVLKNRFAGDTGVATRLRYDKVTGRLQEASTAVFSAPSATGDSAGQEAQPKAGKGKPRKRTNAL
jgi:twinkle protein